MRLIVATASLVASALFFTSCSSNSGKWDRYTDPAGAFSVMMPTHGQSYTKTEITPFGKQVVHYATWKPATFELNKVKLVQVSYTDCPKAYVGDSVHLNAALDSCISLRKKDFTEVDEIHSQPISFNNYPGRAFIYDPPKNNVITIVKEFFANNKRFDLTLIVKKDYPTNNEVNNFFNSFQVLK
jgi:hypothetical protein